MSTCATDCICLRLTADSLLKEKQPVDVYVNTKEMLDTFNKGVILKKMPPPHMHTLFVELVQVEPGSDGKPCKNGSASAPVHRTQMINHHPPPGRSQLSNGSGMASFSSGHQQSLSTIQHPSSGINFSATAAAPSAYAPPPPPWSRWGTMSTPAMPPSTQRRGGNVGEGSRSNGTPQPSSSRKRKHTEESLPPPSQPQHPPPRRPQPSPPRQHSLEEDMRQNGSAYPQKRHAGPGLTATPAPLSPRPIQTLSPSLAMIVSPTNQDVHTSSSNQLAPLRNGTSGSPILPPVKSLISGDPL